MKYYVIAGEASGDLHASNLIKGLKRRDSDAQMRGWGGDLMRAAGCEIVRHYKDTAIMGFLTVLKNLDKIKANIDECRRDILAWRPDVVILVDYGDSISGWRSLSRRRAFLSIIIYRPRYGRGTRDG